MNNELIKDDIVFEEEGCKITFHSRSYMELVKGAISEFGNKSNTEAEKIIRESVFFSDKNYPPRSFDQVALLDHEDLYHIAMLVAFGDGYWRNTEINISSTSPKNFNQWKKDFCVKNNLKSEYIEYSEEL